MLKHLTIIASCTLLVSGVWAQEAYHSVIVHSSNGTISSFPIEQVDSITFDTLTSVQRCKWYQTIENPGIADYLRDFEYDPSDYSYHKLFDYRGTPYLDERQDWPYGVTLGDTTYYNLIPNRTYSLEEINGDLHREVKIQTLGQLRQIRLTSIANVRDLGGWETADGKHIKYGLLYRGPQLDHITATDLSTMRNELGVKAELDLRTQAEITMPQSPMGKDIGYCNVSINYTMPQDPSNQQLCVLCLQYLLEQLRKELPVYIHCLYGADRTGMLCMLIEGVLGVRQTDLDKDYELTSFCGNTRYRTNANYQNALNNVLAQPGNTLKEKFHFWWLNAGATEAELTEFETLLLER